MFERRLKIFFLILCGVTLVLLLRAGQLQVVNAKYWEDRAKKSLKRETLLETTRGSIVDFQGRVLAQDEPGTLAAVDFRAIEREPKWMGMRATARLLSRAGAEYRKSDTEQRKAMLAAELARLNADIDNMWRTLAEVSGKPLEEIGQIQASIRRRVDMRRRYVWYARYKEAMQEHDAEQQKEEESWLEAWLLSDDPAPELESFNVEVSEQTESHVILNNVSNDVHIRLKKRLEEFPGLELRPSKYRHYPLGDIACHVIGRMSAVTEDDLLGDPNPKDGLRKYLPNDQIGRAGIEALADQALRGSRGRVERLIGDDRIIGTVLPTRGQDVMITVDVALQKSVEDAFRRMRWTDKDTGALVEEHEMHGAAVVIDVPTGQVRALVSYPTYDLNTFDEQFARLADDYRRVPLMNRATQTAVEPGSTVKPIVGIGAITDGIISATGGIECTGYMIVNGKPVHHGGRCWTAKMYADRFPHMVAHHQLPDQDPHPTGRLTFSDALQRSCNVYFESLGATMRMNNLCRWFRHFGLGQKTGIGIAEWNGRLPDSVTTARAVRHDPSLLWFTSIGQGQVTATPVQMANVAATIARNGIWVRPTLVTDRKQARLMLQANDNRGDRMDLRLDPSALAAARDGMVRVVNSGVAGTGKNIRHDAIVVAGKTGTAQAPPLRWPTFDEHGKKIVDEKGRERKRDVKPNAPGTRNPEAPWYRVGARGERTHAWFIGYAPADNPQIAFAVMLEYGGSGGAGAGMIAKEMVTSLINHNYLQRDAKAEPAAQQAGFEQSGEPLPPAAHDATGDEAD